MVSIQVSADTFVEMVLGYCTVNNITTLGSMQSIYEIYHYLSDNGIHGTTVEEICNSWADYSSIYAYNVIELGNNTEEYVNSLEELATQVAVVIPVKKSGTTIVVKHW